MKLSTGKLNYHLKILEPLPSKGDDYYKLNDKGNQLAEIIPSLGNDKEESQYYRLLPQFLTLVSFIFLIISVKTLNSYGFYVFYVISIIALYHCSYFIHKMKLKVSKT